ncbi:hypothetical protein FB561_5078 [Kribbella amoyensis]|uniref:DoxX-like protein n=1 Tax=Kribbella amoyensis TaxID=996641 RepID=A0A561BYE1_9ACTN|nr:hypothetical protein [Kribbella amoyensis]TWD83909.1 hypothetical protein FB561_5078 [Kribbella amoyensis]
MRGVVRAGLITLAAIQVVLGLWTALFPASFYNDVPTVDWTPPYSEHLFRDFGGATLGIAVVVIAAAVWFELRIVVLALVAYLLFSAPHLVFHAHHLRTDSPLAVVLVIVLALSVLLPLLLIFAARSALGPRTT